MDTVSFGQCLANALTGHMKYLAEGLGIEVGEFVIFYGKADLDWFAAYLAVFDVGLSPDGQIQHHRDFFSTIWTTEFVFHRRRRYCNQFARTTGAAFGKCLIWCFVSAIRPDVHRRLSRGDEQISDDYDVRPAIVMGERLL